MKIGDKLQTSNGDIVEVISIDDDWVSVLNNTGAQYRVSKEIAEKYNRLFNYQIHHDE